MHAPRAFASLLIFVIVAGLIVLGGAYYYSAHSSFMSRSSTTTSTQSTALKNAVATTPGFTASPSSGSPPLAVTFSGILSSANPPPKEGVGVYEFSIDFGDNTQRNGSGITHCANLPYDLTNYVYPTSCTMSPVQHQYSSAGTYVATLSRHAQNGADTIIGTATVTVATSSSAYGMSEYSDKTFGFSFWYPEGLTVSVKAANDTSSFPGGTLVQTLEIGSMVWVGVVDSVHGTITDEPLGHASPINQTKYFYDMGEWLVAYPEGANNGAPSATTTADETARTIGDLPMLPSGRRFDTTIIPLSATRFVVVSDGGGSMFTPELAATVAAAGISVSQNDLSAALEAEAAAYAKQSQ